MPRIIIVGGGFAGLKIARKLNNTSYEVLLIDKVNHHQFQPLFYQVATAGLDASNISFPLRSIFHNSKNVDIRLSSLQKIIPEKNAIVTSVGEFSYDYLVIAAGADTNFFGNKNFEQFAIPMKSTSEALQLRYKILQNFEDVLSASEEDLEGLLNIVVVGGGPTGVELAGALAEMRKHVLPKDYHDFDFSRLKITLIEGGSKTLATMSEPSSKYSKMFLENLGVEVILNARVKDYDGKLLTIADREPIKTNTVIWAAGVKGNLAEGLNSDVITPGNRIKVDRFNRVAGYENIFALGDIAFMVTPKYPKSHPQLANVAITQAALLGDNFIRMKSNKPMKEFEYHDKGSLATVGKHKAVADFRSIKFQGVLAWYAWMGLHLVLLMGFKNQIFVFIDWIIAYFTNNSTLRLIFRPFERKK
jgi:NADH:ubiquinone reductase (H+-translocating)